MCSYSKSLMDRSAFLALLLLLLTLCIAPSPALGVHAAQSDWSGGPGQAGPVVAYQDSFATAASVSWLALPGQLALGSVPRDPIVDHPVSTSVNGPYAVHAADIDDDGDVDILSAGYGPDDYVIWRNEGGDPIVWTKILLANGDVGGLSICPGDVDADGCLDILGASWNSGTVSWWRNIGGDPATWTQQMIGTGIDGAHQVTTVDYEGDGDLDVFAAGAEVNCIRWWRNLGGDPVAWSEQTIDDNARGARSVAAGDVDGDGDCDAVSAAQDYWEIYLYLNEGGDPPTWSKHRVFYPYNLVHWVELADMDLDGDLDILAAAFAVDDLDWWRNEGGSPPVWTRVTVDHSINGVVTVHAADLDGDGDQDVVGAAWDGGKLKWWENLDDAGTSWQKRTIDDGLPWTSGAYAADVDGDGDLDALGTSVAGDEIAWYEIVEFETSGDLTGSVLDLGVTPESLEIGWTAELPAAASLTVELRTGEDPGDLGAWNHALSDPGTIPGPLGRYLQYRLLFSTTDTDASPIFESVSFSWPLGGAGIGDGETGDTGAGGQAAAFRWIGPTITRGSVAFEVPTAVPARIEVFDVAGRCVRPASRGLQSAGYHLLDLSSLPVGTYLCRVQAGEWTAVQRIAIVR